MDHLRRRRRDEDEWRERAPQRDAPQGADAESLLDLQARAGNRAVTELVGAHGTDAGGPTIQRDGEDGTPTATPDGDKGAKPRVNTMSIPELKLGVPVQSFEGTRRAPGREGGREMTAGEVTVGLLAEHFDSRLFEASAKGRVFSTVTITLGPATITLHGVLISGVQMSKDATSLTLHYTSIEINPGPPEKESPPAYDLGE
ncbi:MAG TPA: hypothetical protein VIZ22_09945 [Candidatus Limnocylindrales bacterium]